MARPRQRTPALREAIIAAACEIYDNAGPDALTTRAVAAAASTSPAAIAELVDGKPGLLAEVAAAGFNRLESRLAEPSATGGPRGELTTLAAVYRLFGNEHRHVFDLMTSRPVVEFGPAVTDLDAINAIYETFTSRFGALLSQPASDTNVVDSATGFVGLLHGLALQERSGLLGGSPESTDRRWTHAVHLYLDGAAAC